MTGNYIWAVNNQGKIFLLSTSYHKWQEIPYTGIEFKRVSACPQAAWAVGGDHQLYVYAFSTDIPIVIRVETYENQRWNPKDGFCDSLLPTDRPKFSSECGQHARPKDGYKLPSLSWKWDGDWSICDNLDGRPLGEEGWSYSIDFPAKYNNVKSWQSLVRRRKWIRTRRYIAVDAWSSVPCVHSDPVQEPFIDVSVGGYEITAGVVDSISVWTVTVLGRVLFRSGVTLHSLEGSEWIHVATPKGRDVNQVSSGPSGLVWAITWDGVALVRLGIDRNNLTGTHWAEVGAPAESSQLFQISVGSNVVWAVTRDGKTWFRRGVTSNCNRSDASATGDSWVEMLTEMSMVSVGPNDQVWALSRKEPRTLCFRTGVTHQDLNGKTWRPVEVCKSEKLNVPNSIYSLRDGCPRKQSSPYSIRGSSGLGTSLRNSSPDQCDNTASSSDCSYSPKSLMRPAVEDLRFSRESLASLPGVFCEDSISVGSSDGRCSDAAFSEWLWVAAGGCQVDSQTMPGAWFAVDTDSSPQQTTTTLESWKRSIKRNLQRRLDKEMTKFNYERAVEKSMWIKTGKCCYLPATGGNWTDCRLELECRGVITDDENDERNSSLVGYDPDTGRQLFEIAQAEVVCVCALNEKRPCLGVWLASNKAHQPIKLAFFADAELDDWQGSLSAAVSETLGVCGPALPNSVWATTNRGEVFVHNPKKEQNYGKLKRMYWRQFGGHMQKVESSPSGVTWGLGYDRRPWVYTGGWGEAIFSGLNSSSNGINPVFDSRVVHIYENQRWNPLSGFSNHRLPTDRPVWSDKSGKRELNKDTMKLITSHWHWASDWTVDHSTPDGVDKDGWQYATDFPMQYRPSRTFTDYARRRRWYRKMTINTSGPWTEVESEPLCDYSLQVDSGPSSRSVMLWAITKNGYCLCRVGVSPEQPAGTSWEHVELNQSAVSVSVGGSGKVWVVGQDGSVHMRSDVNENSPQGRAWYHVEPPDRERPLAQISAGTETVWAVDKRGNLWRRQEVQICRARSLMGRDRDFQMSAFPEGSSWKFASSSVRQISVDSSDNVWAIVEKGGRELLARRKGITTANDVGSDWEYGIGISWQHVSARAARYKFESS